VQALEYVVVDKESGCSTAVVNVGDAATPYARQILQAHDIPVVECVRSDIAYIYNPFTPDTQARLPSVHSGRTRVRIRLQDLGALRDSDLRLLDRFAPGCLFEPLDIASRVRIEEAHPNASLSTQRLHVVISHGTRALCCRRNS